MTTSTFFFRLQTKTQQQQQIQSVEQETKKKKENYCTMLNLELIFWIVVLFAIITTLISSADTIISTIRKVWREGIVSLLLHRPVLSTGTEQPDKRDDDNNSRTVGKDKYHAVPVEGGGGRDRIPEQHRLYDDEVNIDYDYDDYYSHRHTRHHDGTDEKRYHQRQKQRRRRQQRQQKQIYLEDTHGRLVRQYTIVYIIVVLSVWLLQGPYLYPLDREYGLDSEDYQQERIVQPLQVLLMLRLLSSATLGTLLGAMADTGGRKRFSLLCIALTIVSRVTKRTYYFPTHLRL